MENIYLMIDGEKISEKSTMDVLNPATGELVGKCPLASKERVTDAVNAAKSAFTSWSGTSDTQRKEYVHAMGNQLEAHAEELARLLTLEQGKPLNGMGSRFELAGAQAWAHFTADLDMPIKVLQDNDEARIELHRKPLGVVGSITPWNWPLMIAIWHLAPALRTGNTVVIKPSPLTPLSTLRMIELINEVLPPGVVNSVAGYDEVGPWLTDHDGIQKITFTGSTSTGRHVMKSAARTLKRITLELGGNDAGIVLPDAKPDQIAEAVFWGAFLNNGQTCAALKRLYVPDNLYHSMCDALVKFSRNIQVGNGLDEDSLLGPIQNKAQFDKVCQLVDDARHEGGEILCGGAPVGGPGFFYPVTLIAGLSNGSRIVDEEQFGPVLPIIRYSDIDEAVNLANDSEFGLGGSVWSPNLDAAYALASRLECGSVWLNQHGAIQPNAPFGGIKSSGIGIEFGTEGLEEFTSVQVIYR